MASNGYGADQAFQFLKYSGHARIPNRLLDFRVKRYSTHVIPSYKDPAPDKYWLMTHAPSLADYDTTGVYVETTELGLVVSKHASTQPCKRSREFYNRLAQLGYEFNVREFVATFSDALGFEYGEQGIHVKIVADLKGSLRVRDLFSY